MLFRSRKEWRVPIVPGKVSGPKMISNCTYSSAHGIYFVVNYLDIVQNVNVFDLFLSPFKNPLVYFIGLGEERFYIIVLFCHFILEIRFFSFSL